MMKCACLLSEYINRTEVYNYFTYTFVCVSLLVFLVFRDRAKINDHNRDAFGTEYEAWALFSFH